MSVIDKISVHISIIDINFIHYKVKKVIGKFVNLLFWFIYNLYEEKTRSKSNFIHKEVIVKSLFVYVFVYDACFMSSGVMKTVMT